MERFPTSFWVTFWIGISLLVLDVVLAFFSINAALLCLLVEVALVVFSLLGGLPVTTVGETNSKIIESFGDYKATLWNAEKRASLHEMLVPGGKDFGVGDTILRLDELYLDPRCYEEDKLVKADPAAYDRAVEGPVSRRTEVYYKLPQTKRSFRDETITFRADDLVVELADRKKIGEQRRDQSNIFIRVKGKEYSLREVKKAMTSKKEVNIRPDFLDSVNGGFYIKWEDPSGNIKDIPVLQDAVIDEVIDFTGVPCKIQATEKSEGFLTGGLVWVGPWPFYRVRRYHFTWMSMKPNGKPEPNDKSDLEEMRLRDDLYVFVIPNIEVSVELQVTLTLSLKIRIVNPYKSSYSIEKWLESINQLVVSEIRGIIGEMKWREVLAAKRQIGDKLSNIILRRLCNPKGEDIERRYGIRILVVNMYDLDPVGVEDAISAPFKAEQARQAAVIEARGQSEAMSIVADGRKEAIQKVNDAVQQYGQLGQALEYLEALKKLGEKEGKVIMLPAPDYIQGMLSGLIGSKGSEVHK